MTHRLSGTEVENALDALLNAIEAEDDRRTESPPGDPVTLAATPCSEVSETDPSVWKVRDLASDPIGRACREQIRTLGALLFDVVGSTAGMRDSLQRVADRCPEKAARRTTIMDKWWNGLGAPGRDLWFA